MQEEELPEVTELDTAVFRVTKKTQLGDKPIIVLVVIEEVAIEMELDTGAAVTIVSYVDYLKYFCHIPLSTTTRQLHVYSGSPLEVAGEITVKVKYNALECQLPMLVVKADKEASPLFGRAWLRVIKLDWSTIFSQGTHVVKLDMMKELQSKYADILKSELVSVKGTKATLQLKKNVKPVFCKARSVPFALRPAVEKELERMQSERIIMPVEFSEWATPLVCVPKPDGTVRLCGDYRTTVNQATHTEQFPIPTVEEIRSRLAGGEKFSKIDLKSAYQQMLLDEKSQELCTINTHKGLFRYTRLPFGVSSSPAIWQRFMEQVLSGMTSICVMLDDVLITGQNDNEHMQNLEEVFQRFQKYGLRLRKEKCAFLQSSVKYYGLCISKEGVSITKERLEAIHIAPHPNNITELHSFLGLLSTLSSFIPNLSELAHPLNELLCNKPWKWNESCEKSFQRLKVAVTTETVLAH